MSCVLVLAETRRGELRQVSLDLVGAACTLRESAGGRVVVAVVDREPERYVEALSVAGVDELILVSTPTAHFEAHVAARALEALIEAERPMLVLLGHTVDALGVGPAVAARCGLGFASDVTGVAWGESLTASRGAYGDKLARELEFPGKTCTLLMLRAGAFEAATVSGAPAVRSFRGSFESSVGSEHVSFREVELSDVDITAAPFLISVGRGVGDEENIARFEALAERFGATLSGVAAAGRRGLGIECAPGRAVGEDGHAARTWHSASPGPCSIWPACVPPRRSLPSTPIPTRRSSAWRTMGPSWTCSSSPMSSNASSASGGRRRR